MKIQTWSIPAIPPKLTLPKVSPEAQTPAEISKPALATNTAIDRINPLARPLAGAPVHQVVFSPHASAQTSGDALKVIRGAANLIVEHCGWKAKAVNAVVWLTLDGVNYFHEAQDPRVKKSEKIVQGTELLSSTVSLLGTAAGIESLEKVGTTLHFVAMCGDKISRGEISLAPGEVLEFSSAPDASSAAEILKLSQIVVTAN